MPHKLLAASYGLPVTCRVLSEWGDQPLESFKSRRDRIRFPCWQNCSGFRVENRLLGANGGGGRSGGGQQSPGESGDEVGGLGGAIGESRASVLLWNSGQWSGLVMWTWELSGLDEIWEEGLWWRREKVQGLSCGPFCSALTPVCSAPSSGWVADRLMEGNIYQGVA